MQMNRGQIHTVQLFFEQLLSPWVPPPIYSCMVPEPALCILYIVQLYIIAMVVSPAPTSASAPPDNDIQVPMHTDNVNML